MRNIASRVLGWITGTDTDEREADTDGSDDSGVFAGSVLDSSVNYSHGQRDAQAASEMAEIQDEANRLAEQDRHRER
ncbi:hypothetical protein NDI54_11665 [Haloarcula sp. S1AR25-5A]|uniref:Uncharacterized protein n=1 Tax=Haloarcula terrestris TaxID=2950533 RepID=A0AAE4JJ88_9EURY|nr:hypothetical protein [Haloarcula terrestris]MDS0222004.1 hypothetical protein [Haloarcula terrestris]